MARPAGTLPQRVRPARHVETQVRTAEPEGVHLVPQRGEGGGRLPDVPVHAATLELDVPPEERHVEHGVALT